MEVVRYCASKKRLFLVGVMFFLIMCISGIYALNNEINDTETTLSTSAVEIKLEEYNGSNEPFTEDGKIVMPGEEISLVPRVNNLGIECYLRTKITYTINNEEYNELDYIDGNYASWDKKDGYYYYGSTLGKEESVDLFNEISIPDNLTNEYQGKKVIVNILVEAIQAKNFDGNWEGIEIKESVNRTYDINSSGSSTVVYENNAQQHITLDDGFFDNLGGLLPGDSVSENVEILNSSKDKNKYYLRIDKEDLSDEERKLLENINLIIKTSNGTVLSTTNLADLEKLDLGTYESGKGDTLTLEVSLPKELDNEFSKILTKITWRFSLELIESAIIIPETWDLKFDLSITVFLLSALGLLIVLILEKKEKDKIEKNN